MKWADLRVTYAGSKVILYVGVVVWRQQFRGATAEGKAQQDKKAEILTLKTGLQSYKHHKVNRAAGVFACFEGVSVSLLFLAFRPQL